MRLDYVDRSFEIKLAPTETKVGKFTGYGAMFGNIDAYDDVIQKGAFTRTLAEHSKAGTTPKMLLQHGGGFLGSAQDGIPIGKWTHMAEDSKGLEVEGELFAVGTERGQYIYEGLKSGALDGLSIGYVPVVVKVGTKMGEPERTLIDVDLHECSIVTFPANAKARVDSVKSGQFGRLDTLVHVRDFEDFLRDAGGFSKRQATAFVSKFKASLNRSDSDGTCDEAPAGELLAGISKLHGIISLIKEA